MGFVDDDEVEWFEIASTLVDALDTGNQDWRIGVAFLETSRIESDLDIGTKPTNLVGVLFQQLLDVGQDQYATIPLPYGVTRDLCQD